MLLFESRIGNNGHGTPNMTTTTLVRRILWLAKLGLAVALLAFLVVQAARHEGFARLVREPKNWGLLAVALLSTSTAVAMSFVRWHLLVRTLGLPFRLRDAMRLGSLGFLLNFVALGSVGGDLFKAIFLAREQPGQRIEAVATVVIDRMVGLYALLLVACGTIWITSVDERMQNTAVSMLCDATVLCALLGAIGFCFLLVPGFTGGRATSLAGKVPVVGQHVVRLVAAVRIYRSRLPAVFTALAMSIGIHCLLVFSISCIAVGLPGVVPTLGEHFFIVPLSMVAGAIPITPNGLGTMEGALEILYQIVPMSDAIQRGTGTVVAIGYRLTTLCVAAVGAVYYLAARREVAAVMHDANELADAV